MFKCSKVDRSFRKINTHDDKISHANKLLLAFLDSARTHNLYVLRAKTLNSIKRCESYPDNEKDGTPELNLIKSGPVS